MNEKAVIIAGALLAYGVYATRQASALTPGIPDTTGIIPGYFGDENAYDPWNQWMQYYPETQPDTAPAPTDDWLNYDPWNDWITHAPEGDTVAENDDETDYFPGDENGEQQSSDGGVENVAWSINRQGDNLNAFLKLLRVAESRDNYGAIVGGGQVTDYREHPWVIDPARPAPAGFNSNASGAYQFIAAARFAGDQPGKKRTWEIARDAAGVRDFSPASQDAAAVAILKFPWRQNAYADVIAGNFDVAMRKLAPEWESLAKILDGTYPITYAQAKNIYVQAGGNFAQTTIV